MARTLPRIALTFAALAGCGSAQPTHHVSVTTATPPCIVTGDESLDSVRARCRGAEERIDAHAPSSLHLVLVPAAPVVTSGGRTTITVRASSPDDHAVTIDVATFTRTRIFDAAGARADLAGAEDEELVSTTRALPVILEPNAALLVTFDVEATQRGAPTLDCTSCEGSCEHARETLPTEPLAPGLYTLELELPWRARVAEHLATLRTPLTIAPASPE